MSGTGTAAEARPGAAGNLLIATFSGRSLAASARRAGFRPLVADLFADNDLRDLAEDVRIVRGDFVTGFDADDLMGALEELAEGRAPVGVVCGPGFEDRPDLLDAIGKRWRLFGNDGRTVRGLKDPAAFARLCADVGIRHPEVRMEPPAEACEPRGWLSKRVGAAGGLHIGFLGERGEGPGRYYQRFVLGDRRSALFVASKGRATILGFSEQWPSPGPNEPFRYGGACGPIRLGETHEAAMRHAVEAIAAAIPALVGLGSADFIVPADGDPVLLEINPRPGASLDVFDREDRSLVGLHLAACTGHLPGPPADQRPVRAAGFAYLDRDAVTIGTIDWPDWVSDRPALGTIVRAGEPIFTLKADGETADDAISLFGARLATMKNRIEDV